MSWSPFSAEWLTPEIAQSTLADWLQVNADRMIMHHEKQLAFWRSVKQSLVAAAENPTGAQVERIEQAPASVAAATIAAPTTPQAAVKAVSPVHGKPPSKPGKPAKFNPAPVGGGGGATPKAVVKKPPAPSEPSPASPASGGKKPGHKPPPPPARGGGLRGGPATGRKPPTPSSSAGGKFRPVQGTSMARKPPAKVDTSPPQEPDVADLPDVPESPTSPKSPPAKKVGSKNAQLMAKLFGGGSNPLAGMAGGKPPGGFKKKKASSGGDSSSALGTRTGRAATAAARPSTQLQRATCVLDYRPTMTGHLALRSGDVVTVLDRSGPEWHVTYQGQQGLVPKTYLEIVGVGGTGGPPKSVDDTAKPRNTTRRTNSGGAAAARGPPGGVPMVMPTGGLSALKKGASPANALAAAAAARAAKATAGTRQSRGSIIDGPSSHDDAKPTVPKRKAKQAGDSFVKTVYDYSSDDPNDLHFDEDEIIRVTAPDNEGWTSGELLGKVGVFPSNYVEPVDAAVVALAEYDYETEDDGFLSFPDNVFLIIHDRSDDSWWEAEYKGQKGLVPANYMKVVKE